MWKFALGYVILQVRGLSLERFINDLVRKGIRAWDVCRVTATELSIKIPCKDFDKLIELRRKHRCSIHILGRCGVPFFIAALWRRKVLLFGLLLSICGIVFLSTRLLFITVSGVEGDEAMEIIAALEGYGIRRGANVKDIDWVDVATTVGAQTESIKWLGLNHLGVVLYIEAREATPQEAYPDYTQTCEIVADREGMITRINCTRGQAAVEVGDWVNIGDILISDTVVYQDFPPYYTHAEGEVWAAMQYNASVVAPTTVEELVLSGNTERYYRIELSGHTLFEKGTSFERYETVNEKTVQSSFVLCPITVTLGEYAELISYERELSEDESKEWGLMMAELQALSLVPNEAEILVKNSYAQNCDGQWIAFCSVTTEESIGVQRITEHE